MITNLFYPRITNVLSAKHNNRESTGKFEWILYVKFPQTVCFTWITPNQPQIYQGIFIKDQGCKIIYLQSITECC